MSDPKPSLTVPSTRPKRTKTLTWDEETMALHDVDRGTRMKIDEPDTPFASYQTEQEVEGMESFTLEGDTKAPLTLDGGSAPANPLASQSSSTSTSASNVQIAHGSESSLMKLQVTSDMKLTRGISEQSQDDGGLDGMVQPRSPGGSPPGSSVGLFGHLDTGDKAGNGNAGNGNVNAGSGNAGNANDAFSLDLFGKLDSFAKSAVESPVYSYREDSLEESPTGAGIGLDVKDETGNDVGEVVPDPQFESKRNKHYNEFEMMKRWKERQTAGMDDSEEDEDEDEEK